MDELERKKKVVHDISLLILYESVDRGGKSLVREIYGVLLEVGLVVGKLMDEARVKGGK